MSARRSPPWAIRDRGALQKAQAVCQGTCSPSHHGSLRVTSVTSGMPQALDPHVCPAESGHIHHPSTCLAQRSVQTYTLLPSLLPRQAVSPSFPVSKSNQ